MHVLPVMGQKQRKNPIVAENGYSYRRSGGLTVERRFDWRYPAGSLEAKVEFASGTRAVRAGVLNFSGSGAQLLVNHPANGAKIVKVDIGGAVLYGEVHYNNVEGDRYLVGIQFNPRLSRREVDAILSSAS